MTESRRFDRRQFLAAAGAVAVTGPLGARSHRRWPEPTSDLDEFIRRKMEIDRIPGVAACIVKGGQIVWSNAYGSAHLERGTPMSLDALQNIGSISKTFTTTALLQLWERKLFRLDDDVSDFLPFRVRNPRYTESIITFRQLLTHQSSIRDGAAYSRAYACGDPQMPLAAWIAAYLKPGGRFYAPAENFHEWKPEEGWEYCNVAYGLVAYLVERISSMPFAEYCRRRIFEPLNMRETSWYLADIDTSKHSIPYTYRSDQGVRGPSWGGLAQGVIREEGSPRPQGQGHHANCLYNHPNYPDGFLRTSVLQLSRYLIVYLNGGQRAGARLLEESTVRELLTSQVVSGDRTQGLTWYADWRERGHHAWGHGGSDPGINTDIRMLPKEGVGAIAFMNTNGVRPYEITKRLLQEAKQL